MDTFDDKANAVLNVLQARLGGLGFMPITNSKITELSGVNPARIAEILDVLDLQGHIERAGPRNHRLIKVVDGSVSE